MNPQKVSVDTSGDVSPDETNLFQKSTQLSSKKAAGAKLLKVLGKHLHQGKPEKRGKGPERGGKGPESGGKGPEQGPPDPEVEGTCIMLYGHEVDMGHCATCYGQIAEHYDEEAMMEDPNGMVRTLADMADECMGTTNQLTSVCEEHYGEDVPLFDCMMCGEICQCDMEGCPEPECHPGCMAGDEEVDSSSSTYIDEEDCSAECKMFYGPEAEPAKCKACAEQCFETASGAVQQLAEQAVYDAAGMVDFERLWFETFVSCSDACMEPLVNLPSQICKAHYGEEVDLVGCYTCGMMCGCDLEGNCEWCDHGECMAGEMPGSSHSTYSSYVQKAKKAAAKRKEHGTSAYYSSSSDSSSYPSIYSSSYSSSYYSSSSDSSSYDSSSYPFSSYVQMLKAKKAAAKSKEHGPWTYSSSSYGSSWTYPSTYSSSDSSSSYGSSSYDYYYDYYDSSSSSSSYGLSSYSSYMQKAQEQVKTKTGVAKMLKQFKKGLAKTVVALGRANEHAKPHESSTHMDPCEAEVERCAMGCIFPNGYPAEESGWQAQPTCFDPQSCLDSDAFMGCFEGCLGADHFVIEGLNACRQHHPGNVMMCMECGMFCQDYVECAPEDCGENPEFLGCHPTCMDEHPGTDREAVADAEEHGSSSYSSYLQKAPKSSIGKAMHKHFQAAMAKIQPAVSDVTDLMQTHKHLK